MAEQEPDRRPHIFIQGAAATELYTSPVTGRDRNLRLPQRSRQGHADGLLNELGAVVDQQAAIIQEQKAAGLDAGNGLYLQFESDPDFDLDFERLENRQQGIELLSVKPETDGRTVATVFVPEGRLEYFFKRIEQYRDEQTAKGHPRHERLIAGIGHIRMAVLEALWTDDDALFPADDEIEVWWEVWLRVSPIQDYEAFLRAHGNALGLTVHSESIRFLDRIVVLVRGSKGQVSHSVRLLAGIAELRHPKETAQFFAEMGPEDQGEWIAEAIERIQFPVEEAPVVCVLDTGVNRSHPLLVGASSNADLHSYNPAWGSHDHHGHGTEMAGLSLLGDLTAVLANDGPIPLYHRLESVKILPPAGENEKHLYGAITGEAVGRAELERPERQRIFYMAVMSCDDRDRGRPSSWSAAIDDLAYGDDMGHKRLFVISAGNTDPTMRRHYPESNLTDTVHDPGQAWNALTVGAFTEKMAFDPVEFTGWECTAPLGDLSPASCTSATWARAWPVKPDIVLEGGNFASHPNDGHPWDIDALRLLTTGHRPLEKPLVTSGDTSAAAALGAGLTARLQAAYPLMWPETNRALLVHSADWTPAMRARFDLTKRKGKLNLLRYCGYGVPDTELLLWSAADSLTLVAQDDLQPFTRVNGNVSTRDINLHTLPWPTDILQDLGETEVEMRVTLSYFIQPNPGSRGWSRRYRYASHGLRFEVKTPEETSNEFRRRINKAARDEEHGVTSQADAETWFFGPQIRSLGTVHSDRWYGTATDLAAREMVAVYPVTGWWKERANMERWGNRARYALIISIRTPPQAADIYTPVANRIAVEIAG